MRLAACLRPFCPRVAVTVQGLRLVLFRLVLTQAVMLNFGMATSGWPRRGHPPGVGEERECLITWHHLVKDSYLERAGLKGVYRLS